MTDSNKNQNASHASTNWVDPEVLSIQSTILNDKTLNKSITYANLLQPNTDPTTVLYRACKMSDRVCCSRFEGEEEFFYVDQTFFTKLGLRLPFSDFQVRVLNEINVAPTQLHPNSWAFIRSFELLCESATLFPTVSTFFYFFKLAGHNNNTMSWVFLHRRRGRKILEVFDRSYKKFKECFFRVESSGCSIPFFMDENRKSKFPLYWSKFVRSPDSPSISSLSDSEKTLVNKLAHLEPSHCADLIGCFVVDLNLNKALEVYPNAILHDLDESEDEEKEVVDQASPKMKRKEKRVSTLAAIEQRKKPKVTLAHGAAKQRNKQKVSPEHTSQETYVANPTVEFEHLHAFNGEGRIASMWDRRFDFDRHVREQLFFCSDQDKLRRSGYADVGRFVKSNALRIAAGAEFLVEEVGMRHKEVQCLVKEKHMLESEVSRLAAKLEKEKTARLKAEGQLARCEEEVAKSRKESEYTEGCLVREWKKSLTESFQNALEQVRLGFPHLNLTSITLDPFKVVEGEQLVEPPITTTMKLPRMRTR